MAKWLKELQGMCPRSWGPAGSEQAQKQTATYEYGTLDFDSVCQCRQNRRICGKTCQG
jgi:hypothetical protein